MLSILSFRIKQIWRVMRRLSGDDAYEQYLKHYAAHQAHAFDPQPLLDKKAFYKLWEEDKWKGIKRCC